MRIISDCNTVFIHHMLKGAGIDGQVTEVLTNLSSFVRCQAASHRSSMSQDSQDASASDSDSSQLSSSTQFDSAQRRTSAQAESASSSAESANQVTWDMPSQTSTTRLPPASHKLVVQPRHDYTQSSHGCPMCPANLCKVSLAHLLCSRQAAVPAKSSQAAVYSRGVLVRLSIFPTSCSANTDDLDTGAIVFGCITFDMQAVAYAVYFNEAASA